MIKIIMEKSRFLKNHQKQQIYSRIPVVLTYHLLELVICFLRQVLMIMTRMFFGSFERTHLIQINNISFPYNRSSAGSGKTICRFRIQLLLTDKASGTRFNMSKIDGYTNSSTDWTLVSFDSTAEIYGKELIYDEIVSPVADMFLIFFTITHSKY